MKDRDTAIEALQYLISWECTDTQFDYLDEIEAAIAMLKEQEVVEPKRGLVKTRKAWFCGACGFRLNRAGRYCSKCGQAVKWE